MKILPKHSGCRKAKHICSTSTGIWLLNYWVPFNRLGECCKIRIRYLWEQKVLSGLWSLTGSSPGPGKQQGTLCGCSSLSTRTHRHGQTGSRGTATAGIPMTPCSHRDRTPTSDSDRDGDSNEGRELAMEIQGAAHGSRVQISCKVK